MVEFITGAAGCGKTTTARLLIQLYKQTSGAIKYFDADEAALPPDVDAYTKKQLRLYREKVKYIFQDPARSLNPRLTVYNVLTAGLKYSSLWQGKAQPGWLPKIPHGPHHASGLNIPDISQPPLA